ncbi:hypothetical protein RKE29_01415 [Streptomyces sp. B1866]|uniref:hypothetical protein n=1 Tax=Streptomyces sp. B1866 TaxID=3075431 RepID=UPI00288EEC27|nr:hypothetical protein [Streptomyces sp. B1866]MDT3395319.1 hypothetical protein [Streptomyces sp. B1866]
MTDATSLDATRRLIERRYGQPFQHLARHALPRPGRDHDPVLDAVVHLYQQIHHTQAEAADTRQALRRLLDTGQDSTVEGTARLLHLAQDLHALTTRHTTQVRVLADLLGDHQPPPSAPAATGANDDDLTPLLPLARRIAANHPHLTRTELGAALRARGIRVSNQRLGALLHHLRAETLHAAA